MVNLAKTERNVHDKLLMVVTSFVEDLQVLGQVVLIWPCIEQMPMVHYCGQKDMVEPEMIKDFTYDQLEPHLFFVDILSVLVPEAKTYFLQNLMLAAM